MISGDLYNGDLLLSVLQVDSNFYNHHLKLKQTIKEIIENNTGQIYEMCFNQKIFERAITLFLHNK